MGDPREKPPDHLQAEVGMSNPQRWDVNHFRALKISVLNHSATGATYKLKKNLVILSHLKLEILQVLNTNIKINKKKK